MAQYDTTQLDTVQHPTLGKLQFPASMPLDERNQVIDGMLAKQQPLQQPSQQSTAASTPASPQLSAIQTKRPYGPSMEELTRGMYVTARSAETIKAPPKFADSPLSWLADRAASIESSWMQRLPQYPGIAALGSSVEAGPEHLLHGVAGLMADADPQTNAENRLSNPRGVISSPQVRVQQAREALQGAMGVTAPIGLAYSAGGTMAYEGVAQGMYALLGDLGSIPIYGIGADSVHSSLTAAGVPDVYAGLASDMLVMAAGFAHGEARVDKVQLAREAARRQIALEVLQEVQRAHPDFKSYTPDQKNSAVHEAVQEVHVNLVARHVEQANEAARLQREEARTIDVKPERPSVPETTPPASTPIEEAVEKPAPVAEPVAETRPVQPPPPQQAASVGPVTPEQVEALGKSASGGNIDALRQLATLQDHPEHGQRVEQIIHDIANPPELGPKPSQLRPGQELPRALGQSIKSQLPARPEPTAPTAPETPSETVANAPEEAVEKPQPKVEAMTPANPGILPNRLQYHLDRMAKLKRYLADPELPREKQVAYLAEAKDRQVEAKKEVLKWHRTLLGNAGAAVANLRAEADKLGSPEIADSLIGFLDRSVNTHEEVAQIRKSRSIERAKGKSAAPGGVKTGTVYGGPSEAQRGVWAEDEGKRRVEVVNWKSKLQALREGKSVPELQSTPEQREMYKTYQDLREQLDTAVPGSPEEEQLGEELKELEKELVLDATRMHGRPKKVDISPVIGKPVAEIETTGAGDAIDPHPGLAYMTQKIWARHYGGLRKGARPTLAQKRAKLEELKLRQEQLRAVAKILEKVSKQAGFVRFGGKNEPREPKRPLVESGFYSFLEKTVFTKMPEKASAEQLINIVRNAGVSKQEIEGTTFDTFLAKALVEKRTLVKSEVLDFINLNKLKFEVTTKGKVQDDDPERKAALEAHQAALDASSRAYENAKSVIRDLLRVPDLVATSMVNALQASAGDETAQRYHLQIQGISDKPRQDRILGAINTLSAAEDVREEALQRNWDAVGTGPKFETYTLPGGENYRERLVSKPTTQGPPLDHGVDETGHRIGYEHLTETGDYRSPHFDEPNILFHERLKDRVDVSGKKTLFVEEIQSDWAKDARGDSVRREALGSKPLVPDFPLEGTWHELALKDIIKQAVEGGYEQIAWTTGEQQADRYNLRRTIQTLSGTYIHSGGFFEVRENGSKENGYKTLEEIAAVYGKEVTHALFGSPENQARQAAGVRATLDLRKNPITIGGEHHIALYNQMIPQFLNRYTKKWGGRVGETQVYTDPPRAAGAEDRPLQGSTGGVVRTVHSLKITPAMRQTIVAEGQRLQGGFIQRDVVGALAAGAAGAAIGGVIAGPVGAVVGGAAGIATKLAVGGLSHGSWGSLSTEIADLRAKADLTVEEGHDLLNAWVTSVSSNPLISDPMFVSKGNVDRKASFVRKVTEAYFDAGARLTRAESTAIFDALKSGDTSGLSPEWQQYALMHRAVDDVKWEMANRALLDRASETGATFTPTAYLDNHNRINWKVPRVGSQAERFLDRSNRMFGSGSFMKQHVLTTFSEGVAKGLEPVSWNPVENDYRSWESIDKFTEWTKLQTHFISSAKTPGGIGFQFSSSNPGEGFFQIKGPGMEVYFPSESGQGLVHSGRWYANDKSLALMFKNATSTDKLRTNPLGRGYFALAYPLSTWRLVGPYHLYAMSRNAFGTAIGFGLRNFNEGLVNSDISQIAKGVQDWVKMPIAPVHFAITGRSVQKASQDFAAFSQTGAGQKLLKNYPNAQPLIELLWSGGGKNLFLTPETMKLRFSGRWLKNWDDTIRAYKKGNAIEGTARAAKSIASFPHMSVQMVMQPMFQWYIPMLKAGVAIQDLAQRLDAHRDDISAGRTTEVQLARHTVNMVEGFFGELNMDNLFWNKTQAAVFAAYYRSFTWRGGTISRLGAAAKGQAGELSRAIPRAGRQARLPKLDENMANWLGILAVAIISSALFYKATKQKLPSLLDLTDYLTPKTGFKDDRGKDLRFQWPDYTRDVMSIKHDPTGYVVGGERDLLVRMREAINNRDFDGKYVADPHDPPFSQFMQKLGHAVLPYENWVPGIFFQQNVDRFMKQGMPKDRAWALVASGAGVPPRWVGLTPAEEHAITLGSANLPQGPNSPEDVTREQTLKEITAMMLNKLPETNGYISNAVKNGSIRVDDLPTVFERLQTPYIQRLTERLSLEDVLSVAQRTTPEEKRILIPIILSKLDQLSSEPDGAKRQRLQRQLQTALSSK